MPYYAAGSPFRFYRRTVRRTQQRQLSTLFRRIKKAGGAKYQRLLRSVFGPRGADLRL